MDQQGGEEGAAEAVSALVQLLRSRPHPQQRCSVAQVGAGGGRLPALLGQGQHEHVLRSGGGVGEPGSCQQATSQLDRRVRMEPMEGG
jgi:hypothetical protein